MNTTQTIAVLNQKGGVGKSTISQNLAAAAHLHGRRTLVLDLDKQGTTFNWFAQRGADSRLKGLAVQKADKVWSVPKFRELAGNHDFIVCDGPARLSNVSTAAAVAADIVLIPIRVGMGEWWACAENDEMLDTADEYRAQLGIGTVRRVYLLNEIFPNVTETQRMIDALTGNVELLPMGIQHRVAYARGLGSGESVLTLEPKGKAAQEVLALYKLILAMGGQTDGRAN